MRPQKHQLITVFGVEAFLPWKFCCCLDTIPQLDRDYWIGRQLERATYSCFEVVRYAVGSRLGLKAKLGRVYDARVEVTWLWGPNLGVAAPPNWRLSSYVKFVPKWRNCRNYFGRLMRVTFVVDPKSRMRMHPGATSSSKREKNKKKIVKIRHCFDLTRKIVKMRIRIFTTFGPLL